MELSIEYMLHCVFDTIFYNVRSKIDVKLSGNREFINNRTLRKSP